MIFRLHMAKVQYLLCAVMWCLVGLPHHSYQGAGTAIDRTIPSRSLDRRSLVVVEEGSVSLLKRCCRGSSILHVNVLDIFSPRQAR